MHHHLRAKLLLQNYLDKRFKSYCAHDIPRGSRHHHPLLGEDVEGIT